MSNIASTEIIRGDTATIEATFKDSAGAAINLTGGKVFLTVKSVDGGNPNIEKVISSFDNPTTGVQDIDLTSTDTDIEPGVYNFDTQFVSSDQSLVLSSPKQTLIIVDDVTRRITN